MVREASRQGKSFLAKNIWCSLSSEPPPALEQAVQNCQHHAVHVILFVADEVVQFVLNLLTSVEQLATEALLDALDLGVILLADHHVMQLDVVQDLHQYLHRTMCRLRRNAFWCCL